MSSNVDREHNIVYGPRELENVPCGAKSLAEFLYKRLSLFPDNVVLVKTRNVGL